jgi:topoisomerase IA-like protein
MDAKKVGQPRRSGVVSSVTQGLSGTRYQIRWDDGHESVIAPGAGILLIEGSNGSRPKKAAKKPAKAAKPKTAKKIVKKTVKAKATKKAKSSARKAKRRKR